jgi:hypothetical protein
MYILRLLARRPARDIFPSMIVHPKPPKKSRPPPACGAIVQARDPKRIATLRMRSEVMRADMPTPVRRDLGGVRKATADEMAECLRFAANHDRVMARIAAEQLLEHLQACGLVLMKNDPQQS